MYIYIYIYICVCVCVCVCVGSSQQIVKPKRKLGEDVKNKYLVTVRWGWVYLAQITKPPPKQTKYNLTHSYTIPTIAYQLFQNSQSFIC